MAKAPVITTPCPLRWKNAPKDGLDFCGQCQRRVHNLDGMSTAERQTFFAACSGEVCVAYTVRRSARIAAIGLASIGISAAVGVSAQEVTINNPPSPYCDLDVVIVGGARAGTELQWVDETEAALPDAPELPEISASEWLPAPEEKIVT